MDKMNKIDKNKYIRANQPTLYFLRKHFTSLLSLKLKKWPAPFLFIKKQLIYKYL